MVKAHLLVHTHRILDSSHNHLSNALSTQGLAANESLPFQSGKSVADRRQKQDHRSGNKAGCVLDEAQPLSYAHGQVYGCAHVVGVEDADELVKGGRCGADAE